MQFDFLEHTADAYIAAYGKTLDEAFENAALAMFETMTDTKTIRPELQETLKVEAGDEFALLYNWLESLIIKFDVEEKLYCNFKVKIYDVKNVFKIKARIWGEHFDPKRHPPKSEVKAVTYHQMEILRRKGEVCVKFILDL